MNDPFDPFTHFLCDECWEALQHPWDPQRAKGALSQERLLCCYCHDRHSNGIYIREDWQKMPCQGTHEQ